MKPVTISLALATALFAFAGAIFFVRSATRPEELADPQPPRGVERARSALEARMADVLGRLDRLEGRLASLERRGNFPGSRGTPGDSGPAAADAPADSGEESASRKGDDPLALALGAEETTRLRSFVHQVIDEDREERRQESERRLEERQREMRELATGPYGQFNVRVNRIGKALDLTEFQKQRYHSLLVDYSSRIEEFRKGLNREDPEAYRSYRDRRKQVQDEFEGLVIQSLTPPQAQDYQNLPPSDRDPALEAAAGRAGMRISLVEGLGEGVGFIRKIEGDFLQIGEDGKESPAPPPAAPSPGPSRK